jgi:hypothetical protein
MNCQELDAGSPRWLLNLWVLNLILTEGSNRYDMLLNAGSTPIQGRADCAHALVPDAAWHAALVAAAAASASLRRAEEQ